MGAPRTSPMRDAGEALHRIMDGEPLTRTATIDGDTLLIDRACWHADKGLPLEQVAESLNLSLDTAYELIARGEPRLLNGAPPPEPELPAEPLAPDWGALTGPCWWMPT